MNRREALLAMGYHESKPGFWNKPIGYQSFSYLESRNIWTNVFTSLPGKVSVWESKSFSDDGSALSQLKEWECWTRTDVSTRTDSSFEIVNLLDL
jgi:hypothetical protein